MKKTKDKIEELTNVLSKCYKTIDNKVTPNSNIQHYINCQLDGLIDMIDFDFDCESFEDYQFENQIVTHINEYLIKKVVENYINTHN